MAGGKSKGRANPPQRQDTRGGGFGGIPHCVIDSAAWKGEYRMQSVVLAIVRHFNGFNNGHIGVSVRELADTIGSHNYGANERAIREAIKRGLIERTADHPKAQRKSREYRLTWIATGKAPNVIPATNEYLSWRPPEGTTREKSVVATATGALRASQQGKEQPVVATATGKGENCHFPVVATATLISMPLGRQSSGAETDQLDRETAGGDFAGEWKRPQSMTEDRWILAQRRAARNPSTPDDETVRKMALAHIDASSRGEQSRLAEAADVPQASFSKFLRHGAPLKAQHRSNIVAAIVRSATPTERRCRRTA